MGKNMLINIAKIVTAIIIISIFFSGSITSIKSLKIINVVKRSKIILRVDSSYSQIIYPSIISIIIFCSAFLQQTLFEKLGIIIFGSLVFIDPLRIYIESKNSGFYSNGVVFLNYSAEWSRIEKYQELENGLRIIHKEKGAFDINLNSYEKNEIILIMNNIGKKKI